MSAVTWLLPVKNGMPYLPFALASIESQTYRDAEILAWDNGSDDGTQQELRRWIPKRIPGRVVETRPMGLGASLAAMVRDCTTELCARMDADDLCHPSRLEKQVQFLQRNSTVSAVGAWTTRLDADGNFRGLLHRGPTRHDDIVHLMLHASGLAHPSVVFRRKAVIEAGNYRDVGPVNVEDYDLWLRMAALGKLANVGETLLDFRVHERSTTQWAVANKLMGPANIERFCENAPVLFGCSTADANLLRHRRHPSPFKVLIGIGKHLESAKVTSNSLLSSSFAAAAKHVIPRTNIGARLRLLMLDWRARRYERSNRSIESKD